MATLINSSSRCLLDPNRHVMQRLGTQMCGGTLKEQKNSPLLDVQNINQPVKPKLLKKQTRGEATG